jgi:hemicentin
MKIRLLKYFFLLIFISASCSQQNKKSLLIIFDGTGSMGTDLAQLRSGANDIIKDFSSRENSPIDNYVLVIFRDPDVEPTLNTKNPKDILDRLAKITVMGGGDCPELAITGLKNGLEHAHPYSTAFVFSDASAKDFKLESEVLRIIQEKQVSINFLLTGDCGEKGQPSFNVYHNIAKASNGQVYDMKRTDISQVLNAMKIFADDKYVPIESFDSDKPGTRVIEISIDASVYVISISVSGTNPILNVTDPFNKTVELGCKLKLDTIIFGCVENPIDGIWNFIISVNSSFSIKLGALSNLTFDFGFSTEPVLSLSETTTLPLVNASNIISIFPNKPELIKNLEYIKISIISSNGTLIEEEGFRIELVKIKENVYSSLPFPVTGKPFKITLYGTDIKDNKIERLLSTTLISREASKLKLFFSF